MKNTTRIHLMARFFVAAILLAIPTAARSQELFAQAADSATEVRDAYEAERVARERAATAAARAATATRTAWEESVRLRREEIAARTRVVELSGGVRLEMVKTTDGPWFGKTEVTRAQWNAVMNAPSGLSSGGTRSRSGLQPPLLAKFEERGISDEQIATLMSASEDTAEAFGQLRAMFAQMESAGTASLFLDSDEFETLLHNTAVMLGAGSWDDEDNGDDDGAGDGASSGGASDFPVVNISIVECSRFIKTLNALPAAKAAGLRFRLPTLSEWRKASLAGGKRPFGSTFMGDDATIRDVGWIHNDEIPGLHPVAQRQPNAWGLYDMFGNVREFVGPVPKEDDAYIRAYGGSFRTWEENLRQGDAFNDPFWYQSKADDLGLRLCAEECVILNEAEEHALREAEERARRKAAEQGRLAAEAAEQARLATEAAEQARREADAAGQARREVEERTRRETEAAERARREAEEQARREAKAAERAVREAEERARREAEAAERIRREAEERARREAEAQARREAEERWLAQKDDPNFKFPLHGTFHPPLPVYKEFQTGCSLEWAKAYLEHGSFRRTAPTNSFVRMAAGISPTATERPMPKDAPVEATEALPFVYNPKTLAFTDEGRTVMLTFGSTTPDGGPQVLVCGELQFGPDDITAEALVGKYRNSPAFSGCRFTHRQGVARESGLGIVCQTRTSLDILSDDTVSVKILSRKGVTLDWNVLSQNIHIGENGKLSSNATESDRDAEVDILLLAPELAGEELAGAISAWDSQNALCNRPFVSILDKQLFRATSDAKTEVQRRAEERSRAEAAAAEERNRQEMERRLHSF